MQLSTGIGIAGAIGIVAGATAHVAIDSKVHDGHPPGLRPRTPNPDPRMWIPIGGAAATMVGGAALAMTAATRLPGTGVMNFGLLAATFGAGALIGSTSTAALHAIAG